MYKVFLTDKADKQLDKLARRDAKKVIKKFQKLSYPFPGNFDIRKLRAAEGFYRLRVGQIRIIFEISFEQKEIWVRKIGYRGGIYR